MNLYKHREDKRIVFMTHDFEYRTEDWNHDNDIYTMNVAYFSEGYNYNFDIEYDRLYDEYDRIRKIKFTDKIMNTEVILKDSEIEKIKKYDMYEKIETGFYYEIENTDGIIFQTDEII